MQTGDRRTFTLNIIDVGVYKDVVFIYVDGIGFVADRNICTGISYIVLERQGYVTGKETKLNGERFKCRILQSAEWDDCMDYDNSDDVWHWKGVYSWVRSIERERANIYTCVLRGCTAVSAVNYTTPTDTNAHCGFRPVLEVMKTAPLTSDEKAVKVQISGEISVNLTINISKI